MITRFVIFMWILDVFFALIVFTDLEEGINASIDAQNVYEVSESRRVILQFNETKKIPIKDTDDLDGVPEDTRLASAHLSPIRNDDNESAFGQTNEDDAKS